MVNKHTQAFMAKHAKSGESVIAEAEGYIGQMMGRGKDAQHNGVLVVTAQRVAFYRKGILGEVIETIPLKSITSVERKSMMGHRVLRIHTSHDALEFKTFSAEGEQALVKAIEDGRDGAAAGHGGTDGGGVSPVQAVRELAALRDAGVISDAEFEAKKAELLARI